MEVLKTDGERSGSSSIQINWLAIIGFSLMITGPLTLYLAGVYQSQNGNLSKFFASAIMRIAIVLPGIGAAVSIISLCLWKRTGKLGRALSIVTVVICNPFFYFMYFVICSISEEILAGLPWM